MSEKNYSGKLNIDVNTFKKALSEAKLAIRESVAELKYSIASSKDAKKVMDSYTESITSHNNKIEALKNTYDAIVKKEGNLSKAARNAHIDLLNEQSATEKLKAEFEKYKKTVNDSCGANENLCHALTWVQQVTLDAAEAIGKKLATAIVDFTKETVNTGLQFETAFAGVKKVVDGTSEDFAKLQSEIRKTATEKPISADALASLYQAGAQLGVDKDSLKDFTNAIIDLQNTSDLTAEAGATMLAQYANVMKLPSEDYERFASTLSYLGSTTATTESRIMAMAQRMSGAGSAVGMTHQGLLALATAMGSVGIEAEMGGSAISTIMLNIESAVAKSNDKLQVWAETAGMTASEFSKLWKTDVTGAIQAVLKGLSDEKAGGESLILTLEELGIKNIRQRQTMLQLSSASDMLTETINKANKEWENNTFLAESSSRVYETTANQMTLLQNSFKEVQLSIYDDLAKPLQDVTKELTEFLKSDDVKKFSQDFATEIAKIGKIVTTVIKGIISNFDKICTTVKAIIPILAGVVSKFLALKTINFASGIIKNVKSLITALVKATTAQQGLNIAMSSNPIGMVATAIGLLITALMGLNSVIGDTTTAYEKQTQKITEETEAIAKEKQALLETREAREANISGIDAEYSNYQNLIDELKTLVDENGNVKEGYSDRVNAIIPLLQNATGEEITLINNQIQGYDNLIDKLDEVIAKKRAEAKISAYEGDYKDAIKGLDEVAKERDKANAEYNEILNKTLEME
ncbi:MAG: phage tail tape measure protein, partial [Lachnospiraceae bacterium]|nr:phage tail tape measure protein [Lachnospiraceae bacterium]